MRLAARSCASFSGLSGLTGAVLARSLVLASARRLIERYDRMLRRRIRVADRRHFKRYWRRNGSKLPRRSHCPIPPTVRSCINPVPQRYPPVLGEISWVVSAPAKEPGLRARCVLPELRPIGRRKAAESRTAAERSANPVMIPECFD